MSCCERPDRAVAVAAAAARAGAAVLAATDRHAVDVETKDARVDLTTSADRESQQAVVAILRETYPEHAIVGEDGTEPGTDSDHVWYVDGLDGTSNFAYGLPWYCVSVGLRCGDEPVAGAVHDPVHEQVFVAGRGCGATCNGQPLRVSPVDRLGQALAVTQAQSSDPAVIAEFVTLFETLWNTTRGVRVPGAPALILSHLAAGHLTAYCERGMDAWDITAGQLILEEAGGRLTDFTGNRVTSAARTDVVATNGVIHDDLLNLLKGI